MYGFRQWSKRVYTDRCIKGCDFNIEVTIFQILKVAIKETTTLPLTICIRIGLEHYNNSDQQINRHGFR